MKLFNILKNRKGLLMLVGFMGAGMLANAQLKVGDNPTNIPSDSRNAGTDLNISGNNADSLFLNVPDAGTAARGVVTTAAQTFGGNKTFQDSVSASKAILAGTSGNANSTVQIAGSLSMAIKSVTADYTVTGSDNTILANTSSTAIVITLPSPANFAGRIYTIKKVGNGELDDDLTITPTSGTIDGGSSYKIYNDLHLRICKFKTQPVWNLLEAQTKVRHNLHFDSGHVYLQNNTLVIGEGGPGSITDYDSIRYIITGNGGTGLLVRENIRNRDNWVIFPIGTDVNAYTPVAIRTRAAQGDDFHARVSGGVKKDLFTGDDLQEISVNKTWETGKRNRPSTERYLLSML